MLLFIIALCEILLGLLPLDELSILPMQIFLLVLGYVFEKLSK